MNCGAKKISAIGFVLGIGLAVPVHAEEGGVDIEKERFEVMRRKLEATILGRGQFEKVSLKEALARLERMSVVADPWAVGAKKSGVKLSLGGAAAEARRFSFNWELASLIEVLRLVAERSGTKFSISEHGVVFEEVEEGELVKEIFAVPLDFMDMRVARKRAWIAPVDPFAGGGGGAPMSWPMHGTEREIVKSQGIALGDSDRVFFEKGTLIVRTTPKQMGFVKHFVESINRKAGSSIQIQMNLVKMPNKDAFELVARSLGKNAADEELAAALKLVEEGKAELCETPSIISQSGQRANNVAHDSMLYLAEYEEKDGKDVPVWKEEMWSSNFSVDPVLGNDRVTVFLNFGITATFGEPKRVKRMVKGPATGRELEVEEVRRDQRSINSSATILKGQTLLVGSLGSPGGKGDSVLVFLSVSVAQALPHVPEGD